MTARVERDASGAMVEIPADTARLVSLVPSVTETLFALGLGERVVGVTEWCLHPKEELARLPRVRGTKNPDIEAVARLAPDLVLANLEENREIDVRRLRARGLSVWVDFPCTVEAVIQQVRWLARLGAPADRARHWIERLAASLAGAPARRPARHRRCFLAVWKDPWMTISAATYAHDLLDVLGLANVFADSTPRYPRVTLEDVAARDPEVVLLPDEPYQFSETDARELATGALRATTAVHTGRIRVIDGTLAFWHGPRTARVLERDGWTWGVPPTS